MDYQQQVLEALEEVYRYNKNLIVAIDKLIIELREEKNEDTKELMLQIVEGLNWEIQILAHAMPTLNEKEVIFTKEYLNSIAVQLTKAITDNEDLQLADVFEKDVLNLLNKVQSIIVTIVDIKEN